MEAQRKAEQERVAAMRIPGMLKPSQLEDKDEEIWFDRILATSSIYVYALGRHTIMTLSLLHFFFFAFDTH